MKTLLIILILASTQEPMTLFDFNTTSDTGNWHIVDDVVMGGKSNGDFSINPNGHGVFKGKVSLENNGGFSMAQHLFESRDVHAFTKINIRLKGDGKAYQFRIKTSTEDYYSYIASFDTSGQWETISIPFDTMYPAFRGRKLNTPNYPGDQMELIAFLIGNKKAESFMLMVDTIVLE
jgi:NADH dehydrogenase [ubiquinone] 1 alpha subcomplex assembly factor 1